MKKFSELSIVAIFTRTVAFGASINLISSDPNSPSQFPCVYGTATARFISLNVEDLKAKRYFSTQVKRAKSH